MDARLTGLAKKQGFTCSRYADDLAFSGSEHLHQGFVANARKTRVMRKGNQQRID